MEFNEEVHRGNSRLDARKFAEQVQLAIDQFMLAFGAKSVCVRGESSERSVSEKRSVLLGNVQKFKRVIVLFRLQKFFGKEVAELEVVFCHFAGELVRIL